FPATNKSVNRSYENWEKEFSMPNSIATTTRSPKSTGERCSPRNALTEMIRKDSAARVLWIGSGSLPVMAPPARGPTVAKLPFLSRQGCTSPCFGRALGLRRPTEHEHGETLAGILNRIINNADSPF